jgi:hypothetical protein
MRISRSKSRTSTSSTSSSSSSSSPPLLINSNNIKISNASTTNCVFIILTGKNIKISNASRSTTIIILTSELAELGQIWPKASIVVFDARKVTFFLMPKCKTAEEHAVMKACYPQMPRWDELEHPINSTTHRFLLVPMIWLRLRDK